MHRRAAHLSRRRKSAAFASVPGLERRASRLCFARDSWPGLQAARSFTFGKGLERLFSAVCRKVQVHAQTTVLRQSHLYDLKPARIACTCPMCLICPIAAPAFQGLAPLAAGPHVCSSVRAAFTGRPDGTNAVQPAFHQRLPAHHPRGAMLCTNPISQLPGAASP